MANIYRKISFLVPSFIRKPLLRFIGYSNITKDPHKFIGFISTMSLLLGLLTGFFLGPFIGIPFWVVFAITFVLTNMVIYLRLILLVDRKARLVEESLPDALQLMSSNLRAGATIERALLLSSRDEFGPLKVEIDRVGKEVAVGKSVGKALLDMAARVNSRRLLRAVELINSGLDSGGSLATLLESTSSNLRQQFLVDKKIKASISMYIIFIFSAAALISPVLFGLSSFLIEVLRSSFSQVEIPTEAVSSLPIKATQVSLSIDFVIWFIVVFMILNALMASMILGLIGKGRKRDGVKYFIPMILLAIPIFFLARWAIQNVLSGLFAF
ncbi:TPA: hypothetical protein HA278_03585 [Candidatus Woesearchaeota archaeon]|nr:hypothetical protein [archaeon]HIJ11112.1 hypothetical protein [Candidatus Woesearchaeota archaeon]